MLHNFTACQLTITAAKENKMLTVMVIFLIPLNVSVIIPKPYTDEYYKYRWKGLSFRISFILSSGCKY